MDRVSKQEYGAAVQDAQKFLSGKSTQIQETLATSMAQASEAMEFERAAALRDRIRALTQVQTTQGINPRSVSGLTAGAATAAQALLRRFAR